MIVCHLQHRAGITEGEKQITAAQKGLEAVVGEVAEGKERERGGAYVRVGM